MLDQADKLRKLVMESREVENNEVDSSRKPIIITVTSGKGGVGKSNFVVNAAICLRKMKKSVLIFDADMGMGNDDVLMGLLPKYSVYDIIFKKKDIEDVIVKGPFGVRLLPGGTAVPDFGEISSEQRKNFMKNLSKLENFDYIIMDTGAGIGKNVLQFISCCDKLIVIMTPEPTSLMDAYSLVKAVDHSKVKNSAGVVINRAATGDEAEDTFHRFNSAVNKFLDIELDYFGYLSDDKKVVRSVKNQIPFVIACPTSRAAKDMNSIINKAIATVPVGKHSSIKGLFAKVFNIFS